MSILSIMPGPFSQLSTRKHLRIIYRLRLNTLYRLDEITYIELLNIVAAMQEWINNLPKESVHMSFSFIRFTCDEDMLAFKLRFGEFCD